MIYWDFLYSIVGPMVAGQEVDELMGAATLQVRETLCRLLSAGRNTFLSRCLILNSGHALMRLRSEGRLPRASCGASE